MARIILSCIIHQLLDDFRLRESVCPQKKQRDNRHNIRLGKDQGKCREQNQSLYILFVHLTKAFDTVCRWVGRVV